MNRKIIVLAIVTAVAGYSVGSTFLGRTHAPPATTQVHDTPEQVVQMAPMANSGPMPTKRRLAKFVADQPTTGGIEQFIPGATVLEEALSAKEVAVAHSYVEPMLQQAVDSLHELETDSQNPDDLATEARTVRRIELWKAVSRALLNGEYRVLDRMPMSWTNPSDRVLQVLPTWRNGKKVCLLFDMSFEQYPGLRDAHSYQREMHRFRLEEAARKYNELGNVERERLYREYLSLLKVEGSWNKLPRDMRERFPVENRVVEGLFLMGTPL